MAKKDPYKYFRVEAAELLERLRGSMLALETRPSAEALREVLRIAHTLKGAAGVVRLTEVAERAHAIEELLLPARASLDALSKDAVDAALAATDHIERLIAALDRPAAEGAAERPAEVGDLAPAPTRELRAPIEDMDALVRCLSEAAVAADGLRSSSLSLQRLREAAVRARARCPEGTPAAAAA